MCFGGGDLIIVDCSNKNQLCQCNLGFSYKTLSCFKFNTAESKYYLAGSNRFKTLEIEVFQVTYWFYIQIYKLKSYSLLKHFSLISQIKYQIIL